MFVPVLRSETISYKNKTKGVGPSKDPWGIPGKTCNSPEVAPYNYTFFHLFANKLERKTIY